MKQNSGGRDVKQLMEMWSSFSTGAIGTAKGVKIMQDFVDKIINDPDPERLKNASGVLNANGLSMQQVQAKLLGANNIKNAILEEFPPEGTDEIN